MCCKGSEIKYKDYTPQDQLTSRRAYNQGVIGPGGQLRQATPYNLQNPFMAQMNQLMPMAMQAMYNIGGGPGQIQLPGYATWGQVSGQPYNPVNPAATPFGGGGGGMQGMAGGGMGGFQGMGGIGSGGRYPFWLNMPQMPQQNMDVPKRA